MAEISYGTYDGFPTAYVVGSGGDAWTYVKGEWVETPGPDVFANAIKLSKEAWKKRFPHVPEPPVT